VHLFSFAFNTKCFREYVRHIFICVFLGVVDYSSFMQISSVVIANVHVLSFSFQHSCGDKNERILVFAVDCQRW
jgi:hypothetical protein